MELWQWHCRNRMGKKLHLICGNVIAEIGGKKKFGNCSNLIAENGKEKKKWFLKSGEELKKILRPQYFYNIFTINYR